MTQFKMMLTVKVTIIALAMMVINSDAAFASGGGKHGKHEGHGKHKAKYKEHKGHDKQEGHGRHNEHDNKDHGHNRHQENDKTHEHDRHYEPDRHHHTATPSVVTPPVMIPPAVNPPVVVTPPAVVAIQQYFTDQHRVRIHEYYANQFKAGHCPPGLAKKHNGCQPPGLAKRWVMGQPLQSGVAVYELPPEVLVYLGTPPVNHTFVRVDSDILLLNIGANAVKTVVDAIDILAGN